MFKKMSLEKKGINNYKMSNPLRKKRRE